VCAVIRSLLNPLLENQAVYLAFMVPIALAAYVGGAGPGILAVVLSAAVANPYLSEFPVTDDAASITHLLLFAVEAAGVVVLIHKLRESRSRTETALTEANAARHLAEHASNAREEFLARVSHEWRGPLNTIAGWLWQLERRPTDLDFVIRATTSMKRAVESQSRFVSDLLDYARASRGKLSLQPQRLAIAEPVTAAVDATSIVAVERNLTIRISDEHSEERVWGDAVRLRQVFTNLLQNAVKFTPPGGTISIAFVRAGDVVQVKVTDTGVGVAPEALSTIFEPFAQSYQSRDVRPSSGLGLGLSIAKDIVEAHGGALSASSAGAGAGTTFFVQLPVAIADEQAPPAKGVTCG
jgi:signal transduction histidine kinase